MSGSGFEQPPGYISPAESNWNALQRAKKTAASGRNIHCPRDGFHQISGLPAWLDGPRIKERAAEEGITYEEAQERFRQEAGPTS